MRKILLTILLFLLPSTAFAITKGVTSGNFRIAKINVSSIKYNLPSLATGLLDYWTFDGKNTNWATGQVVDSGSANNTGQMKFMSTTTSPVSGKIGQGYSFTGTGIANAGRVTTGNITFSTGSLTMSGWIRLPWGNVGATNNFPLIVEGSLTGTSGLDFGIATGSFFDWQSNDVLCSGNGYQTGQSPRAYAALPALSPNTWHQITCVLGPSTAQLYLDGAPMSMRVSNVGTVPTQTVPISMAACGCTGDWTGSGSLDDIRIYNRVLSAAEVTALYQNESYSAILK